MKLLSSKLSFVVASVALVLAGCQRTPKRNTPADTLPPLGPQTGGTGFNTGGTAISLGNLGREEGLTPRPEVIDPLGDRKTLEAQTVYFEFDKSDIKASERDKLKIAKKYLDDNPTRRLLLEGRCDWRGTAEYNLALGDRRANAAKKYLITLGVKADRLETLSKGSLEAAKNADEATMSKDRCVNLIVVDPARAAANPL
jgi:peptidoglycan-associated lipoprotein